MQELNGLAEIRSYLDQAGSRRLFLVVDAAAWEHSHADATLAPLLDHYDSVRFDQFTPNPQFTDAVQGLALAQAHACDAWMAFGGGTAIDICKLIRCFASQTENPAQIVANPSGIVPATSPFVAIPTTAGTGSEATQFAVVYVDGQKHSLGHPSMRPTAVVLDAELTRSMPPRLAASSGLDALSQATESLWSVRGTEVSRADAARAFELGWPALTTSIESPNAVSRQAMLRAAHLAGRAINVSQTTAPHAVSYYLTSKYGLSHGFAVALTLGAFLEYNAELLRQPNDPHAPRMENTLQVLGRVMQVSSPDGMHTAWTDLAQRLGCPTRLSQLGITTEQEIAAVAAAVNAQRLANNPRPISQEQLVRLLESIA
jgi:alcohol dehydrogenase